MADWSLACPVLGTAAAHLLTAVQLTQTHRLQFWDGVIIAVAQAAHIDILLTEDMQDGALIGGVRLLNPFDPANREQLDALLTPVPGTA